MERAKDVPVILCFSGHDPTGGAGMQADIETIVSLGGYATTVITALTIQDTQDVQGYVPIDEATIAEQARAVLEDMQVAAFKIGMVGSVEAVEAIVQILDDYPDVPVVLDPVLASGKGTELADREVRDAIKEMLVPLATIITPNSLEARALAAEADTLDACAHELIDMGCEYVFITGSHENTKEVVNTLYNADGIVESYTWERLPHTYHGSGCVLSAAIATLLGAGLEIGDALQEAQEYTWESLSGASRLGMGQWIPNRLFWVEQAGDEGE